MSAAIPTLTPQELAALLQGPEAQQPTLLDVRTRAEHALVALPGSVLIPLDELDEQLETVKALKEPVVVYCHHGVRSMSGAAFLLQHGLAASSLSGGIERYAREVDPSLPRY